MRLASWLCFAALLSPLHGEAPAGWKLVWSDEFDRAGAPDPAKWSHEKGFVRNWEKQFYTADRRENCRLEKGRLIIEARKEKFETAAYTSASITTKGKASWKRGRFEVRAKVPAGRGTWAAAWLLASAFPETPWPKCGEIDIMEFVGHDPAATYCAVHCTRYNHINHNEKVAKLDKVNPSAAFHVYALEWHDDRLDFFFDGRKHFTYRKEGDPAAWPFDQPHYFILNLAIGGSWGGKKGIDDSRFPHRYEVDYVRVYQQTR